MKACDSPQAEGLGSYTQALAYLGSQDGRVGRMAEDAVPPLVPVLETGSLAAKEEAALAARTLAGIGEPMKVESPPSCPSLQRRP
eukprot:5409332-Pyramimonas_sp.AAC.1